MHDDDCCCFLFLDYVVVLEICVSKFRSSLTLSFCLSFKNTVGLFSSACRCCRLSLVTVLSR